jgi:hypothetical protein
VLIATAGRLAYRVAEFPIYLGHLPKRGRFSRCTKIQQHAFRAAFSKWSVRKAIKKKMWDATKSCFYLYGFLNTLW